MSLIDAVEVETVRKQNISIYDISIIFWNHLGCEHKSLIVNLYVILNSGAAPSDFQKDTTLKFTPFPI